jgi:hypothetical protein
MFTEGMTNGRGFMGVAACTSARPTGAHHRGLPGVGLADSIGGRCSPLAWPSHVILLMPYVVTVACCGRRWRSRTRRSGAERARSSPGDGRGARGKTCGLEAFMEKRKIILDCDPGHDDAVAIMLPGGARDRADGHYGVSGNQTIEKTVKNALNVCQYLDLDVPVVRRKRQPAGAHAAAHRRRHSRRNRVDGPPLPRWRAARSRAGRWNSS